MRIIAGKYKGLKLHSLEGNDITRPSKDNLKEALFSSLGNYLDGSFLDLFGGSGAVGLEALSRGAKEVVINDQNAAALKIIKDNTSKLDEDVIIMDLDYRHCLKALKGYRFDHIFLDPPYSFNDYDILFDMLYQNDLLKDEGIIVVESKKELVLKEEYAIYRLYKMKRYGISKLSYYKKGANYD